MNALSVMENPNMIRTTKRTSFWGGGKSRLEEVEEHGVAQLIQLKVEYCKELILVQGKKNINEASIRATAEEAATRISAVENMISIATDTDSRLQVMAVSSSPGMQNLIATAREQVRVLTAKTNVKISGVPLQITGTQVNAEYEVHEEQPLKGHSSSFGS